jgi:hypothetical protein
MLLNFVPSVEPTLKSDIALAFADMPSRTAKREDCRHILELTAFLREDDIKCRWNYIASKSK